MIESISAIRRLPTICRALSASIACWDLRSFMVVMTRRLRVFGLEQIISISSLNRPSEIGLGGDALSSTIPTLTLSMRAWLRRATVQTRHRKMLNGANGSSTSPTRMVTNLASLGRCDSERPMAPWHLRYRASPGFITWWSRFRLERLSILRDRPCTRNPRSPDRVSVADRPQMRLPRHDPKRRVATPVFLRPGEGAVIAL
jgi:hypothetical protein